MSASHQGDRLREILALQYQKKKYIIDDKSSHGTIKCIQLFFMFGELALRRSKST